jgi:hypothetical protein
VGNWHTHAEQPRAGLNYNQEALSIFAATGDRAGQAATLDLLAITSYMGGDMIGGTAYYEQAIGLFRELGDQQGLDACLGPFATRGASPMHDTMVEPLVELSRCIRHEPHGLKPGGLSLARQPCCLRDVRLHDGSPAKNTNVPSSDRVTLISREISGVATLHGSAAPCAMIGAAISLAAEVDDAPHDTIGRHA